MFLVNNVKQHVHCDVSVLKLFIEMLTITKLTWLLHLHTFCELNSLDEIYLFPVEKEQEESEGNSSEKNGEKTPLVELSLCPELVVVLLCIGPVLGVQVRRMTLMRARCHHFARLKAFL